MSDLRPENKSRSPGKSEAITPFFDSHLVKSNLSTSPVYKDPANAFTKLSLKELSTPVTKTKCVCLLSFSPSTIPLACIFLLSAIIFAKLKNSCLDFLKPGILLTPSRNFSLASSSKVKSFAFSNKLRA